MLTHRTFFLLFCLLALLVTSCGAEPDEVVEPATEGEVGAAVSELCSYPPSCTTHADCAGMTCGNECVYELCSAGKCVAPPKPSGTVCQQGSYPWRVCNGSGSCAVKPASSNCITAVTNGNPLTNCNDYNLCTQDVWDEETNTCKHFFYGFGAACGDPDFNDGMNMSCASGGSGMQCCPVAPVYCTKIGQQGECAAGSVCMEGRCFIACDPNNPANYVNPGACQFTPFPTCGSITEGTVTRYICM